MPKTPRKSSSGHSTPQTLSTSRPSFPSISLRSSDTSVSQSHSEPKSARSSLLNVLSRPRPTHAISNITASSGDGPLTPEDEQFSDYSTISSYASSVAGGSRQASSEELAEVYKNYLETPFVSTKQTIKHSEYGHCNNPNWRWTSQVRLAVYVCISPYQS
jgi:serine palmitoyltransferase